MSSRAERGGIPSSPAAWPHALDIDRMVISGPAAEATTGQFVSAHQSIGACSLLLQVPAQFGVLEGGF